MGGRMPDDNSAKDTWGLLNERACGVCSWTVLHGKQLSGPWAMWNWGPFTVRHQSFCHQSLNEGLIPLLSSGCDQPCNPLHSALSKASFVLTCKLKVLISLTYLAQNVIPALNRRFIEHLVQYQPFRASCSSVTKADPWILLEKLWAFELFGHRAYFYSKINKLL